VYDDQPHAQAVEQRDIMHQQREIFVSNSMAAEGKHESSCPMSVDIRRRLPEGSDKIRFFGFSVCHVTEITGLSSMT
jgi:hypothetical protein